MSARMWGGHIVFPNMLKFLSCVDPSAIHDSRVDLKGVLGGSWMGSWGGLGGCSKGFGGVWRGI